ncbi:hypothetical protein FBU59_004152, partial [Linderina macrospora]
SYDNYRRSASPDHNDAGNEGGSRGYKRDRSGSRDRSGRHNHRDSRRRYAQPSHLGPSTEMPETDGQEQQPETAPEGIEFQVPSRFVGLVIGRKGENLRHIEQQHGVRVQVSADVDKRDPERRITVEGPLDRCEAAKQAVLETIERHVSSKEQGRSSQQPQFQQHQQQRGGRFDQGMPPMDPEDTVTVMVPSNRVGLIIGKGGESIRNIQAMSGARVQVQQDTDRGAPERPVHLIGTPEQIEIAQARIMEIVNGDNPMRGGGSGGDRGYPGNFQQQQQSQDGGYGGGRGGTAGSYDMPQDRFQQQPMQFQEQRATENMDIPAEAVGIVIGRGGETIKYLQQASGARIQIIQGQDRSAPFKPVTISGSPGACQRARQMIEEKVASVQVNSSLDFVVCGGA